MLLPSLAVIAGIALLIWSAERFIDGAAVTARYAGMPPLLIGMVIVGFGTSAPELVVSVLSAYQGKPGIALGNAYGSNIANIALILGLTALLSPIAVHSQVLRKELPLLAGVTGLSALLLWNGILSRLDAALLLAVFGIIMAWTIWSGFQERTDTFAREVEYDIGTHPVSCRKAIVWLIVGLILLIVSSRILVWGAVEIAQTFGVSDLLIGLTVVAVGTSLPELASSIIAVRKGEHEITLGNVLGSNLFNTLAVVGLAGSIKPMTVEPEVLSRDMPLMAALTVSLLFAGYRIHGGGRINRLEGAALLTAFIVYMSYLIKSAL